MILRNLRSLSSMRTRMTAGFVFVLAPCLVLMSHILPLLAHRGDEQGDRGRLESIAKQIREIIDQPDWQARISAKMASTVPKESHAALLLIDQNGTLVWRTPGRGPAWPPEAAAAWRRNMRKIKVPAKAEKLLVLDKASREGMRRRTPEAEWRLVVVNTKAQAAARAEAEAQAAGKRPEWVLNPEDDWHAVADFRVGPESRMLTLVMFQSWSVLTQERTLQKLELLLFSLFAVLGVAGGTWVLVGRTLSPIRRLALQAGAASVENLQVRLKAPSRDAEVVELVDTLNGLLTRLAETAAVKGRFYAAASHELRTPLQALSGHLEVSLSRGRTSLSMRPSCKRRRARPGG